MPELHLSFAVSSALLLLLGAAAIAFALWSYRSTIPPVSSAMRRLLLTLRLLVFLLLILLIGGPVLSMRWIAEEQPSVLVLVDNSLSMTLRDGANERSSIVRRVLDDEVFTALRSRDRLRAVRFDRTSIPLERLTPDSLTFTGAVTDLAAAFRKAKEIASNDHIRAVVLVSDGNATQGPTPLYEAEALGLPVFTIGIGDTSAKKDVQVRSILTNETAYARTQIPFRITIRSAGYGGERIDVVLRRRDSIVAREAITLQPGIRDYTLVLNAVPAAGGREFYTAEIAPLAGEATTANNRSSVTVRVLRSKMRLMIIAGGPNPDVAFIRRVLDADENIDVRAFTENAAGAFLEGDPTDPKESAVDALVLIGYPRSFSDRRVISWIRTQAEEGAGLFFILGRTVDPAALSMLTSVLPFTLERPRTEEMQVFASIPDAKAGHELLTTGGDGASSEGWKRLAPVFRWQSGFAAKPEADVLAQVRVGSTTLTEPMIVVRNVNRRRSLAVAGYGIWRWQMLADPTTETRDLFRTFVERSVRWLTTKEDDRRVRVEPEREIFSSAEQVTMVAQVYDEAFRPVERATVRVQISGQGISRELECADEGNGQYIGVAEPIPEGIYSYTATATSGKIVHGEDRGTVRVGAVAVEFLETAMNKSLLQQLAKRTGGAHYDAGDMRGFADAVVGVPGFVPRERRESKDVELWNLEWMLAALVGLVVAEWVIRKRKGML